MIDKDMLESVKALMADKLVNAVNLILNTGENDKKAELKEFLTDLVSTSPKLSLIEKEIPAKNPLYFYLEVNGENTGIGFSGIPAGHEFSSLILALLRASGVPLKLDEGIQKIIKAVGETLNFEVFVSLSCHNCPEVVQSLNDFALLNKNISVEMIEGGAFPEEIEKRNIQGVPSVFLNGERFTDGKIDAAKLISKLLEKYPNLTSANAEEKLEVQDIAIIGAGPAGSAAAIYAARKGLKVALIGERIGGQVKDTQAIENLIGTPLTSGNELALSLKNHIEKNSITVRENISVSKVENGDLKKITLQTGEIIEAKTLIIATGAKWKELNLAGEKELLGRGIAYCPHCDGPFFKNKDVAVVGGGNSAIEAALDLAGIVKSVKVLVRSKIRADQVLVDRANATKNIEFLTGIVPVEILTAKEKVAGLKYQNKESGEEGVVNAEGIFVQIGLIPNTDFLGDLVEKNKFGEIVINEKCQTSQKGIFAAGDCSTVPYKQIIVAMGEGAKAALSAFNQLVMSN